MLLPFISLLLVANCCLGVRYEPTWESVDTRPIPDWYDDSKFGIFIHWGVYSVPSFTNEWFWEYWQGEEERGHTAEVVDFMKNNYRPDWTYADFATQFTAEFYDAQQWAEIFKQSGAKYVVLTAKHHDGYCLWPTKYSFNWNSMDVGPNRDLVGELSRAIRTKTDLHFGLYHSMYEWFNPLWIQDRKNNYTTSYFVDTKAMPELYELVNTYKPDIIWSDGAPGPSEYWKSTKFLAWLYNDSPVRDKVVTNDRWGSGCRCTHGGVYTCHDGYHPEELMDHKWENCLPIDTKSWGFRRNSFLHEYLSINQILKELISTVSYGGNMLLNVGPTKDGRIAPIYQERLKQVGDWLEINGEAIFRTKPWLKAQTDSTSYKGVWYTSGKEGYPPPVYAITLNWPEENQLLLGSVESTSRTKVELLGHGQLKWRNNPAGGITVTLPNLSPDQMPCEFAWSLKLSNIRYE